MLGSPAGPGGPPQRGLWSLAPAPSATSFSTESLGKCGGLYSLFPSSPGLGSAFYSHASAFGRFSGHIQQSSGNSFHTTHKVSDSLFSTSGYTFGAPTPPPGSPYSPIPFTQLELLTKGFNSSIIIQQPDYPTSPKKIQEIPSKRCCDEKYCKQPLTTKTCQCQLESPMKHVSSKYNNNNVSDSVNGCSRTNPIDWGGVNVKKEPGATPCQVAEITTSMSPIVKLEVTSPTSQKPNGESIVGRQRMHEFVSSPALSHSGGGLLTTVTASHMKEMRMPEIGWELSRQIPLGPLQLEIGTERPDSTASSTIGGCPTAAGSMAANTVGGVTAGGAIMSCSDDRSTGLAAWQMGGAHSQSLAATPTLWQYPAPVPMEPMVPLPVPMPPVGYQLIRDPNTGGLLLLPTTTGIEPIQQAVVWPSYNPPSSVLLPSLPPPPLQLLSSGHSDYLASSTTLQHTQTHSTRLVAVTTDTKRKIPLPIPATTLIKIETDHTLDQTKTLQAVSTIASNTGTVFTDPNMTPLVTTHVIYQHPTTNLILSSQTQTNTETTTCRSQGTSPACLTPPPDTVIQPSDESLIPVSTSQPSFTVQDAGNQTDTPICSEDDTTTQTVTDVIIPPTPPQVQQELTKDDPKIEEMEIEEEQQEPEEEIDEVEKESSKPVPETNNNTTNVQILESPEEKLEEKEEISETPPPKQPDLSGLELLSNSIVEFENCSRKMSVEEENSSINNDKENIVADDNLGGLDLLCALAEQRILEENNSAAPPPHVVSIKLNGDIKEKSKERKREKRKSKKHSDEPRRKKSKSSSRSKEEKKRDKSEKKLNEENNKCSCRENYRSYKTPESEEEARKFIASKKTQSMFCKGDWPFMNTLELDMRMRLAELQREYREKQKELSKLKPKKHDCSKKRSRKKSHSSHDEQSQTPPPILEKIDEIPPIKLQHRNSTELLKPPTLCAMPKIVRPPSPIPSDVESSPEKSYSSSKRKVGRPKKLLASSGENVATETIVAKKPKSIVGYLLAAKEKLQQNHQKIYDSPTRYVEEETFNKPKKFKNNNHIILDEDVRSSKIRPKLKAEATVKTYTDEEPDHWEEHEESHDEEDEIEDQMEVEEDEVAEKEVREIVEEVKPEDTRCTLTAEHLEVDKCRVLTAMGGLFYAGHLNAVQPPDVYSITLDGERGNRPHFMSREEILRDAIVEVSPKRTEDLPVGTRLCAYWSQQYRCLYPGSVAEPGTPNPQLDERFVSVEFDDGDSGRIALDDIRFLPPDYPMIEYDPNPLLSLSKRKRRTSSSVSMEERKHPPQQQAVMFSPISSTSSVLDSPNHRRSSTDDTEKDNRSFNTSSSAEVSSTSSSSEKHKEKKRVKKKKRDKGKEKEDEYSTEKKKKKKRKCDEDDCEHKRCKKHRKHKRHQERNRQAQQAIVNEQEEEDVMEEEEERTPEQREADEEAWNLEHLEEPEVTADEQEAEDVVQQQEDDEEGDDEEEDDENESIEDEGGSDDITSSKRRKNTKKIRDRQESCESRSRICAFLPDKQLWSWGAESYKRHRIKGRSKKAFYKVIQRGREIITVGDAAVFLSTGRPDRPYIGRINAFWEMSGTMTVKVKWFYHPEETVGGPLNLQYPGALFESSHEDENDVQTISHKCDVLSLEEYRRRLGDDPQRYAAIYENNDLYYKAGQYDPIARDIEMAEGIPVVNN